MDPRSAIDSDWLIWAGIFIAVPAGIGHMMGASWKAILTAFGLLALLACILGFPSGSNWDQRMMWAAIFWMIGCIPGIPLILLALRMGGLR